MLKIKTIIPEGFIIGGISCGISGRKIKKDVGLIFSQTLATAAACFTRNKLKAAPVQLSMKQIENGKAQLIIANSVCANACTGKKGLKDAEKIIKLGAKIFGIAESNVLIASTGTIGDFLPLEKIKTGMESTLPSSLGKDKNAIDSLATAIMTTDSFPKFIFKQFHIGKKKVNILGIAKGAGMICPDLATMFCFILTDININRKLLKKSLLESVQKSFNIISVDGEMSTNDCVIILANGQAKNETICHESNYFKNFQKKLDSITLALAKMIIKDGEGATKLVEVKVKGAKTYYQANLVARRIAHSPLFKTALFGNDPNWGRILAACGSLSEKINSQRIDVYFNNLPAVKNSTGVKTSASLLKKVVTQKEFTVTIDLKIGKKEAKIYTCDFSFDYVKINSS
ncbi:bifunctional glutamate N-acetyltransferase/amino-acid acetyltransferase ArgJ [bacterium]|nr:bifunctional glutamate N-acetyltransferase/amino-acid acetyltransferase ArgJ [bacterium]